MGWRHGSALVRSDSPHALFTIAKNYVFAQLLSFLSVQNPSGFDRPNVWVRLFFGNARAPIFAQDEQMRMNSQIAFGLSLLTALVLASCSKDSLNTLARCGNGELELGEACDDGNLNADDQPYVCRTDCTEPTPSIRIEGPTRMATTGGFTDTPDVPLQHVHNMILCGAEEHVVTISIQAGRNYWFQSFQFRVRLSW